MEEVIWVEILTRHRVVVSRFRFYDQPVTIGRGYDNDVIVDDPYVAARHVRIFRDEMGKLVAEDLGNGLYLARDSRSHARIVIDGNRPIRIGRTYLRIREASHAVPAARDDRSRAEILPGVWAAALSVVILAIEALSVWLAQTTEPKASNYVIPLLTVTLVVAVWAALWALLSRIFSGRSQLVRNLVIALSGLLIYSFYEGFVSFAAFSFTWPTIAGYTYVGTWTILAATCFFHLRQVGPSRLKLKGALVATLCVLGIGVQVLVQSELSDVLGQQSGGHRLLPPALRLSPVHDEGAFFARVEQLKTKLDNDRVKARDHDIGK